MRNTDSDWLGGDDAAAETAITERPPTAQFWLCGGESFEPEAYETLTEATGEKPATPDALVAGGGEMLAEADQENAIWCLTAAGMRRLDQELAATSDRDSDVVLGVLLAQDFRLAVGAS